MSEIVNKDSAVRPNENIIRSRSQIDLSAKNVGTYRFGHISPHFYLECVNGDKINLRSVNDIRSYTLKAPLFGNVNIKKDYFLVPNEAILPFNWDKIYTAPVIGDDVVASQCNCIFSNTAEISTIHNHVRTYLNGYSGSSVAPALTLLIKYFCFLEKIFSEGSLFSCFGFHLSSCFVRSGIANFDLWFDSFFSFVFDSSHNYTFTRKDGSTYTVGISSEVSTYDYSPREFLEFCRDSNDYTITKIEGSMPIVRLVPFLENISFRSFSINISRILAYQIICSHFYSNDRIDYVYSAELYRQNVWSLTREILGTEVPTLFNYNGLDVPFDYLSGYYIGLVLSSGAITIKDGSSLDNFFDYFSLLFSFKRSLRFVDYFTGSRSNPLAVGDVNINVNSGVVNAVDVSRNIQRQRFFNAVNRVGRRFEEYVKSFGGNSVAPDYHNPLFLAHTSDVIQTSETSNTGDSQILDSNSVTSVFKSYSSDYAFEISVDRPCIVVGVTYFDIERMYYRGIDKFGSHVNRFDMFNQYMQFIGDQAVNSNELVASQNGTFGYALRHLEYKTKLNNAFGGIASGALPGWSFLADHNIGVNRLPSISPDYIRSRPSELDEFYTHLTGWSVGNYFHFIIMMDNKCQASRPMVYNPTIL